MATQFLSAKPRPALLGPLTDHIIGKTRPDSAKPRKGLEPIVQLRPMITDSDELAGIMAEAYEQSHHNAGDAVEILFAGPPAYEPPPHPGEGASEKKLAAWEAAVEEWAAEDAKWTQELRLAWAEDSVSWFERNAPRAIIVAATCHQDENSVHAHLVAAPRTSTGGLAWTRLQAEMWKGRGAPCPRANELSLSGRKFQDLYHKEVGTAYGLDRGGDGPTREALALEAGLRGELAAGREDRQAMADLVLKRKAAEAERKAVAEVLEAERKSRRDNAALIANLKRDRDLQRRALGTVAQFAVETVRQAVPSYRGREAAQTWRAFTAEAREAIADAGCSWPLLAADEAMDAVADKHEAEQRLIRDHIRVAEDKLRILEDDMEEHVPDDKSCFERELKARQITAWEKHLERLETARLTGDLTVLEEASNGPVPGFTNDQWDELKAGPGPDPFAEAGPKTTMQDMQAAAPIPEVEAEASIEVEGDGPYLDDDAGSEPDVDADPEPPVFPAL